MLKKTALSLASVLVLFPPSGFCNIDNDITALDRQRIELLKQITAGLVNGKISIQDAQNLKIELDNVVKLETKAKEDPLSSPEHAQQIAQTLQNVHSHIDSSTHSSKIWLGIDTKDKTLEAKLNSALDHKAITKVEAEAFKQRYDELHAREANGDPTHGYEFDDALALANDIQTFNSDLEKAAAGK